MIDPPRTISVSISAAEHVELMRLRAMERYVASLFDDWVSSVADLMALYDEDMSWDEVLPVAAEEIARLRTLVGERDGQP